MLLNADVQERSTTLGIVSIFHSAEGVHSFVKGQNVYNTLVAR